MSDKTAALANHKTDSLRVGLPIALIARWSAKKRQAQTGTR